MSHRSLFIIVSLLLFSFSTRAQESTPLPATDEGSAALRHKAVDLLQTIAGQVDSLRSGENRARIRSNAAEALWDHDEKRARSLFAAVEEDIKTGLNDTDTDETTHAHTVKIFWQLRSDTVGRIAKHDPELALGFLRSTRPSQLPDELAESERSLELRLAGEIAARKPQLALELIRQSLSKGFSSDLLPLLLQLKAKDRETSRTIHQEIVNKLRDTNLGQDWTAVELALNLVRSFQPPDVDEQVYRDLLGILLTSALANRCADAPEGNPPICYMAGSVFSRIEKYYGSRAAPLKRWASDGQDNSQSSEPSSEAWELMEKGTVDQILALAPRYPELQNQIYMRAAQKATASNDFVRARQIASELPDDDQRRETLTQIDKYQDFNSMNVDGKLALIQKELNGLRSNEERIHFLLYGADQVRGTDRKLGVRLLNQAAEMINATKPGKIQLGGQIGLALMYCSFKSDKGFAIMESLIPRLNELVTASIALDGFDNNYLRDGEWNMTGSGSVGGLLTELSQNVGHFAALDFDRSVVLSSQLERPELRLMAQLKIAQSVLSGQLLPVLAPSYRRY